MAAYLNDCYNYGEGVRHSMVQCVTCESVRSVQVAEADSTRHPGGARSLWTSSRCGFC